MGSETKTKRRWAMPAALIFSGAFAIFFSLGVPAPGPYCALSVAGDGNVRPGEMVTIRWNVGPALDGRRVDAWLGLAEVGPGWVPGLVTIEELLSEAGEIYVFDRALIPFHWQEGIPLPTVGDIICTGGESGAIFFIVTPEIASKTLVCWAVLMNAATGRLIDPEHPMATSGPFFTAGSARPEPGDVSIDGVRP
ncbi:MAG: hypothetical protein NT045_09320 [Candidatus Aureabacteria bacterium]|nr:hypothetical protein [Candidatus Auribacterota bacterium]